MRTLSIITAAGFGAAVPAICVGQAVPSYGLDFVTVGAPGNRATIPEEVFQTPWLRVGAVPYEYRIMRTEVTNAQWVRFLNAYAPYYTGDPWALQLTGMWIYRTAGGAYEVEPGADQWPVEIGWRLAAIYCNWLHNDMGSEAWAFKTGAYDVSTFTVNQWGLPIEQSTRSPGARFWIPSWDEWAKAAFYDPNRYGPGREGYWRLPRGSNEPLISGLPEAGGQTNAGAAMPGSIPHMPVGSYPHVRSPWGLLDVSGGEREWTEWRDGADRAAFGSRIRGSMGGEFIDGPWLLGSTTFSRSGVRLAAPIPSPSALCVLGVHWLLFGRRVRA
ncbi:MAG: formylglycine-generating enzyme family protein [Phycisphaerae bacterium]|nr:formylglycine-generating enzyme family protein [Phycisphaerae bacterium]